MTAGYALFDTSIGRCGIVWGPRGVMAVQLPEAADAQTRERLLQRFPAAQELTPPAPVRIAVDGIAALLRGEPSDLSTVTLDMTGVPDFHRRVYQAARSIGPGATISYGELATQVGSPGGARAVGQALGRNPFAIVVPCHRVLAAGGKVGGFTATGGVATKARMLSIEEALVNDAPGLFEGDGQLGFDPVAAVAHLQAADAGLGRLIQSVGPCGLKIKRTRSLFLALAEAIVYQQLTGKAAATIFSRVRALFPRNAEGLTPARLLRASDLQLRGAGLSQAKTLALRDLARKAVDGEIPTLADAHRLPDEALVEVLTQVRGIGRWTVQMLLMFRLGRPDVLPVDDYGVRKGFAAAFRKPELPTPAELEARGEKWRPYRSAASWYLWRAAERSKRRTAS